MSLLDGDEVATKGRGNMEEEDERDQGWKEVEETERRLI